MSSYINQLNFDFWNFFDQVNHSYTQITMGFYTVYSLFEAIFFNLIKNFFIDKAKLFQFVHTYLFNFLCIFLKTIGIILICNFYRINKEIYLPIVLIINVFLTFISHYGYENSFLYSLSIILIYFLIVFFHQTNIRTFLNFLFFYIFCFSQSPYQSLSYFFTPFYFIIIFFLLNFFRSKFKEKIKNFFKLKNFNLDYKVIFFSILIVIFFNIAYFFVLLDSHILTEDGVSQSSRFERILNPVKYFKTYVPVYRSPDMYLSFFNYLDNQWWQKPIYLGLISYFVALIGAIYSKRNEKYYFIAVLIYILALQGPRDILPLDLSFYAHLFNAILNPFSFLNQHTHMMLLYFHFFNSTYYLDSNFYLI